MPKIEQRVDESGINHIYRDGIELNKNFTLTEQWIYDHKDKIEEMCTIWSAYPDIFIDLITPVDSHFKLYYYQRIFLRAAVRYKYNYCCACRAFSKTFLSILAEYLLCIFKPGYKTFIAAPTKQQGAKVAKEKVEEILNMFPLLRKELVKETYTSGTDYLRMAFRNGSIFDIVAAIDSTRGGRRHGGIIDEVRDQDADDLNEVVLPLLNVDRRTAAGILNPYEVQQNQIFITSAGTKNSYAYQKLIELLELSIISPKTAFVWGCSYKIPLMHGLLNKQYINDIKMSATFNDSSFAREYLSQWTGGGDESWFNYDRLFSYRKLINPENTQKIIKGADVFYILSVDVGRISCQTVVSVFKVFRHQEHFDVSLVNIYVLGLTEKTKHFSIQSLELKKIIARFDPKEIVIDGNGLGVGLLDAMTQEQVDIETNQFYPGYCSFNNEDYRQALYPRAIPKIYVIKSNNTLDSKIHGNCYTKVYSGQVKFLAPELQIKNRLLETDKGQKMSVEQRIKRIMPHELTTKLHEEMSNFRLSATGNGLDIKLQKINSHMLSDKFSSFEYGLWRIKELEDEYYTKKRRKGGRQRKLVFFTEGGGS